MLTIAPSILSCDHCELLSGVRTAEEFGLARLHVDIMDGIFVPNISFGPQLVNDLRKHTSLKLDVHLMLQHPENFVEKFINFGADSVAIHQESSGDIGGILSFIRSKNRQATVAINPETSPREEFLYQVDCILVMGVHPGFSGQKFLPQTVQTVEKLAKFRDVHGLCFSIAVDGGVTIELIDELADSGADVLISGNSFFKSPLKFIEKVAGKQKI